MSNEKSVRSPYESGKALEKNITYLYLGTKGRLPNEQELQQEMETINSFENIKSFNNNDLTDEEDQQDIILPNSQAQRVYSTKRTDPLSSRRAKQSNLGQNIFQKRDSVIKPDWHFVKNIILNKPCLDKLGDVNRQSRPDFYLKGNVHLPVNGYNALKDYYLRAHYSDAKKKVHLKEMCLLTPNEYIIENPNAYLKVKELVERDQKQVKEKRANARERRLLKLSKTEMIAMGLVEPDSDYVCAYQHQEFLMNQFNRENQIEQFYKTNDRKSKKRFRIKKVSRV